MFAIVQNGQIIKTIHAHTAFELNGSKYTAKWTARMSEGEKAKLGITPIYVKPHPDQRFYWVTSNPVELVDGVPTIGYTAYPKDLAELKKTFVAQAKEAANSQLAQTDWMVIRKAERGVEIPEDVQTQRAAILAECEAFEAGLADKTTVGDFARYVSPGVQTMEELEEAEALRIQQAAQAQAQAQAALEAQQAQPVLEDEIIITSGSAETVLDVGSADTVLYVGSASGVL